MIDAIGIELKLGDLLFIVNVDQGSYTPSYGVAIGFTKHNVKVGKAESINVGYGTHSHTRMKTPMVKPTRCIIINHMWEAALNGDLPNAYYHPAILTVLDECNIKPNKEIRSTICDKEKITNSPTEENLGDI